MNPKKKLADNTITIHILNTVSKPHEPVEYIKIGNAKLTKSSVWKTFLPLNSNSTNLQIKNKLNKQSNNGYKLVVIPL